MRSRKKIFARFGTAFLFLAAMTTAPGALQAGTNPALPTNGNLPAVNSIDPAEANGVFEVQVLRGDLWQDAGSLSYDKFFLERTIDIGPCLEDGTRNDDLVTGGDQRRPAEKPSGSVCCRRAAEPHTSIPFSSAACRPGK